MPFLKIFQIPPSRRGNQKLLSPFNKRGGGGGGRSELGSSIQNIQLSYSWPFEGQCFPFGSLNLVNNWCCYESIWKQCYTMQIICLLSFFKVNNIQKKLFQRELNSKSYSLLRGVYVTNCYFLIFFCHFALKFTFFWNQQFLMFSGNLTRIFHEAIPSIYFILFKKQYFCVFWNVSFT